MEPELLEIVLLRDDNSNRSRSKKEKTWKPKKDKWEVTVGPDGEMTLPPVGPGETAADRRKLAADEFLKDPTPEKAAQLQEYCRDRTRSFRAQGICEVCQGMHPTWHCCESCNYDNHRCHFCGDWLGHDEISACYLMALLEPGHHDDKTEDKSE